MRPPARASSRALAAAASPAPTSTTVRPARVRKMGSWCMGYPSKSSPARGKSVDPVGDPLRRHDRAGGNAVGDDDIAVAVDQHFGDEAEAVVGRSHRRAIGAGGAEDGGVAGLHLVERGGGGDGGAGVAERGEEGGGERR